MAKVENVRQSEPAATAAPVATPAPVLIPYGQRVAFAVLSKPFVSKDKKRRYIGLGTWQIAGCPAAVATAQITVVTSESGKRTVEIMFPTGRFGAADPIALIGKDAQEAMRVWLAGENAAARDWLKALPPDQVNAMLTGELSAGSTGMGADL